MDRHAVVYDLEKSAATTLTEDHGARNLSRKISDWLLTIGGLTGGTCCWALAATLVHNPGLLPGPSSVLAQILSLLTAPDEVPHLGMTMVRALSGWIAACTAALPVGILIGYNNAIYKGAAPWLSLGRSLPIFALVGPAVGLFRDVPELQRIWLIWLTLFLIALQTISVAAAFAPRRRIQLARIFGASHWFCLRRIMFHEVVPGIFAALEITLPLSLIVTLVVETFLIPRYGLGIYIYNHLSDSDLSLLFAQILVPGIVGALGMAALRRISLFFQYEP